MFPALLLLLALSVFFLWVMLASKPKGTQVDRDAPVYSKSLPIIGITHMFLSGNTKFWKVLKEISEDALQQGGVVKTNIGLHTQYFIADPEDAATVATECLERHYVYQFSENFFGQSLLGAPVSIWKNHRKLLNPAFNLPTIHGFVDCFNNQAKELVDEFYAFAEKGPFQATQCIHENMLRGICLTAVGDSNIHDKETIADYGKAINDIAKMSAQRFQKIWQHSDLIYLLSGQKNIQDEAVKTLTKLSDKIIQKAKLFMTNHEKSICLKDRQVGISTFLDKFLKINSNNSLSDKEFREELYFIITAAFDTTAHTFEYVLNLIGSHPEIQERVFEEIMVVIGKDKNIHKKDLQKLAYTDTVIKECLRLIPAVPIIGRTIEHDVQLKNCTLRGGTYSIISLYGINHHPSWGPDVNQFRPERWIEPGGVPNIPSSIATFSAGKRNCIGKTYALTLLKILLVHLVRRYRIQADYTNLQLKWDIVLTPLKGNEISLKLRNTS